MEKTSPSLKPSGDSATDSTKTFHSIAVQTQKKIRACFYAGSIISVISLTEGGTLLFVPMKQETLPFLFLFVLFGLISGIAIVVWSYQIRKTVEELLLNVKMQEKQKRSTLAHDIRNILAIIQTDAEIALMGETSKEELYKTLKRIMAEADEINLKLNGS